MIPRKLLSIRVLLPAFVLAFLSFNFSSGANLLSFVSPPRIDSLPVVKNPKTIQCAAKRDLYELMSTGATWRDVYSRLLERARMQFVEVPNSTPTHVVEIVSDVELRLWLKRKKRKLEKVPWYNLTKVTFSESGSLGTLLTEPLFALALSTPQGRQDDTLLALQGIERLLSNHRVAAVFFGLKKSVAPSVALERFCRHDYSVYHWKGADGEPGTDFVALSPSGAVQLSDLMAVRGSLNATWQARDVPKGEFYCHDGSLYVRHGYLGDVLLGPADESCRLRVPSEVKTAIVEVGTNVFPAHLGDALEDPSVLFIGVEPIPSKFVILQRLLAEKLPSRHVALPVAVADGGGEVPFNIAFISTCSSLLTLAGGNNEGQETPNMCKKLHDRVYVPKVPLDKLLSFLPPAMRVRVLTIDAQGFDVPVAFTLRKKAEIVNHLVFECQDLPKGDKRWLYSGSYSCSAAIQCVGGATGFRFKDCSHNHEDYKANFENNCWMVNDGAPDNKFQLPCSEVRKKNSKWPCYDEVVHKKDSWECPK